MDARRAKFVREFLVDLNGTQAAIRAGYSPKGAHVAASRLLSDVKIVAELQRLQAKQLAKVELDAETVKARIREILTADLAEAFDEHNCLLDIHAMPAHVRQVIASIEVDELWEGSGDERTQIGVTRKVKLWSKVEVAKLAAQHLGMLAPSKVEVSGSIEHRVETMTPEQRVERAHELILKAKGMLPKPANAA